MICVLFRKVYERDEIIIISLITKPLFYFPHNKCYYITSEKNILHNYSLTCLLTLHVVRINNFILIPIHGFHHIGLISGGGL